MIKRRRFPKIFPGWWIVLTGGILALWGEGFRFYGLSALFKPISSELGFSRAATSAVSSIQRLEGGFEAPLVGWATDRFGSRWLMLFGIFLMGLGLVLMNYINSLWAFYVVWGVLIGTGGNLCFGLPLHAAIVNWFVKKRGLASSIRWVFSGLSGVLTLPLVAWLIATQGWRIACVIGGLVMWGVGLPLTWFFMKERRPEYYGLLPDGATAKEEAADTNQIIDRGVKYAAEVQEVEFTLRQAMRTAAYWLLMVANTSSSLAMSALSIHVIPFLTDTGIDPVKAAGMVAIMVLSSLPMRLLGGLLADRVKKQHLRLLLGGTYLLRAVGFAVFLLNQTITMIYIWFIIEGISRGIWYGVSEPMRARYFGRKAFGSIGGSSSLITLPIGVITPVYIGWVYDTSGSYITVFILAAGLLVFAAVLMSFILPPKPPAQITDVRKFL